MIKLSLQRFKLSLFAFAELQDCALSTVDPLVSVVTGSHAGSQLTRFWVDWIMDSTPFTTYFRIGLWKCHLEYILS